MQAGGDILVTQKENERPFYADVFLDGSTTSYTVKTSRGANHKFYVQKIVLSITTHANGKNMDVEDSNSSAVKIFAHEDVTAAGGIQDVFAADFGPHGVALTAGKDLLVKADGSTGIVGVVHIEGYEKLSSTISLNGTANSAN